MGAVAVVALRYALHHRAALKKALAKAAAEIKPAELWVENEFGVAERWTMEHIKALRTKTAVMPAPSTAPTAAHAVAPPMGIPA